jgi:transposase-like protein
MTTRKRSVGRPAGTSSRLHRGVGRRRVWTSPDGLPVELPVVVDLVNVDPDTGRRRWSVEAHVDLVRGEPRLVRIAIQGRTGLDTIFLQRFFRWATPVELVRRTVPQLLAAGIDPYRHDYAIDGYPDAAELVPPKQNQRSDDFLEEVVRQYLTIGRGYARVIAQQRGVAQRTVVAWIEKARKRGILSRTRPGQFGGRLVPRSERPAVSGARLPPTW